MTIDQINSRECQILYGLKQGLIPQQIANKMGISKRTYYRHLKNIRVKLNATEINNDEMILRSQQNGLLEDGVILLDNGILAMTPRVAANIGGK